MSRTRAQPLLLAALVGTLACAPTGTHAQDKPPAKAGATPAKTLTIDPAEVQKPRTGDLDTTIERHTFRVLKVYSKTFYTVDKGVQRGAAFDAGRLFVEDLRETPLPLELAGDPNWHSGWTNPWGQAS